MLGSRAVAIEFGRKRLCALQGVVRRGGIAVRRSMTEEIPADLSRANPDALGAWMRSALKRAGIVTTQAVIALSRDEVILKRLSLPSTVDAELPEMTRLAVTRELPFDPTQAVIDFVPVERGPSSTTVLALVMPRGELEAVQQVLKAAGIERSRVSLRAMGGAALVADVPGLKREPSLLIDIAGERIEFSVVVGGAIRFSRAADLPVGAPPEVLTEAIVTETRRTWMSYRIGEDTDSVRQVILMGDDSAAEQAAEPVEVVLGITPTVLRSHPHVDRGQLRLGATWPLAGLLLEQRHQDHVIDMAHPRRPPDLHAKLRMRVLLGAAAMIAIAGATYTVLRADLRRLDQEAQTLKAQVTPDAYWRYVRDVRKLEHIHRWEDVKADWLGHLDQLASLMPPRDQLVLSDFTGMVEFKGVDYESKRSRWVVPWAAHMTLQGEASDREVAGAFRERLIKNNRYLVSASGAEREGGNRLGVPFNYRLVVQPGNRSATTGGPAGDGRDGEANP